MTDTNSPDPREEEPAAPASGGQQDTTVDWDDPATWPEEIGGSRGPEPTRYGDWENNGRCTDF